MTPRILMVIAQRDFRDEEYLEPKKIFAEHDIKVVTASERKGECLGKLGAKVWAEVSLHEVNLHDYEAIVFVGGLGAKEFFADDEALNLVREANSEGKILAAICIAPSILANAGILDGKKVTAFETEESHLNEKGAIFTGNPVEVDGQIITANGPEAAEEFGLAIVKVLDSR